MSAMPATSLPAMQLLPSSAAIAALGATTKAGAASTNGNAKAHAAAVDFEAVFLNTMFNQMFTAMDGDGPMGGGPAVGIWRSFLSEEYAKSFAKSGGIGIADQVYRTLIAQQEAAAAAH